MSKNHPAIKKKTQYKKLPSRHVLLACRRAQLRRFWHVDRHRRHFGMSTGTTLASFWHVDGHEYVVLVCPLAHLLCYTLLFSLSNLLFGIAGRHFGMSTGHFGMSTGTSTILHFTILPVQPTFWHVDGVIVACRRAQLLFYTLLFYRSNLLFGIAGRHFGMSTGSFWHVDGHTYYFTLYYSPCPTYFLASRGVILACPRGHFGMSMGTFAISILFYTFLPCHPTFWHRGHIYYFTLYYYPVQPTFWHRGASFWHVDGHKYSFCHADGHMYYFTLYYSPCPTYLFLASRGVILACRRGHFGMSTDTFTSSHFTFSLSNLLFGIAGRLFGILTGTLSFLQFTILPFQTTFWHL